MKLFVSEVALRSLLPYLQQDATSQTLVIMILMDSMRTAIKLFEKYSLILFINN